MNRRTTQCLTAIIFFATCHIIALVAFLKAATANQEFSFGRLITLALILAIIWMISNRIAWMLDAYRDAVDNEYGEEAEDQDRRDW